MPPAAALPALTPGSSSRPSEGPQPHHAAPPPWNSLGNPLPDCSLHTQNPSQPGPAVAWSLPRCWLVAGSDRSIPTGQQPQQRGSLWEPWQTSLLAQAKIGVLLEAAMLALPCSARFGLPPPVLRAERVGEFILAMTQRGYFFAFRPLLLSLPFTAHHTLPFGTSPF